MVYAEIDVLLENRVEAVAVKPQWYIDDVLEYQEEKMEANIEDIREHLERMEQPRRYFDMHNDRRKLYGVAAVFPEDVRGRALKEGLYVIEAAEDRVEVKIPEGGARVW